MKKRGDCLHTIQISTLHGRINSNLPFSPLPYGYSSHGLVESALGQRLYGSSVRILVVLGEMDGGGLRWVGVRESEVLRLLGRVGEILRLDVDERDRERRILSRGTGENERPRCGSTVSYRLRLDNPPSSYSECQRAERHY